MNCELPDVQAGFRKRKGTRDQIAIIHWTIEKGRERIAFNVGDLGLIPGSGRSPGEGKGYPFQY